MGRNEQDTPCPYDVSVGDDGSSLRIRFRWIWDSFTGPASVCLAWNSFLVVWFWGFLRIGGRLMWVGVIFGTPHVVIGLALVYATLAGLLNHTTINVTSELLTVRHGPVPWWGNRKVAVNEIEGLECRKNTDPKRQRHSRVYGVHVLTKEGDSVDLITDIDRDRALFIKQEVERWLGLGRVSTHWQA